MPKADNVAEQVHQLRWQRRQERLRRMSPERRALYEGIGKLRDEIGRVDIDIVEAIRELREDG